MVADLLKALSPALIYMFLGAYGCFQFMDWRMDNLKKDHAIELATLKQSCTNQCNQRLGQSDDLCKESTKQKLANCGRANAITHRVLASCGTLAAKDKTGIGHSPSDNSRYRLYGADGIFLGQFARLCADNTDTLRSIKKPSN